MDTSDPNIEFDQHGNCNHCSNFLKDTSSNIYKGEESDKKLKKLVNKIKYAGRGNKYDCLIGVSGGVDSSYVAYILKKHGLSPLAVHMDNGWNSKEAVENIKNVCHTLKIDYQSYVLDWNEFRDIQLSVLKSSIPEVEIPTDVAIAGILHKVASKNNIKYIVSGGNVATEGILPTAWFYNPKDSKLLRSIHKKFGSIKIKKFPFFDYKMEIYYKFVRNIRVAYILNYISYSKDGAIHELQEHVGWKNYGGKHHESKYSSFVQSYIQPVKFNIDYRRATLSTQICMGEIERRHAIEELKKSPFNDKNISSDKEYVCKKLRVSVEEFDEILRYPVKYYSDYPNNQSKLEFIYYIYRKYFRRDIV
jgi:N-acetyl sugar amidotransferase